MALFLALLFGHYEDSLELGPYISDLMVGAQNNVNCIVPNSLLCSIDVPGQNVSHAFTDFDSKCHNSSLGQEQNFGPLI